MDSLAEDLEIAKEQLKSSEKYYNGMATRARLNFVTAVISAAVGVGLFAWAVLISLGGGTTTATAVAAIGAVILEMISALNFWLFGRAAAPLDAIHARLDRIQTFLLADSVCASLKNEAQDKVRADIVASMLASTVSRQGLVQPRSDVGARG